MMLEIRGKRNHRRTEVIKTEAELGAVLKRKGLE